MSPSPAKPLRGRFYLEESNRKENPNRLHFSTARDFEPQIWLEMITSRDAKGACLNQDRKKPCDIILRFLSARKSGKFLHMLR